MSQPTKSAAKEPFVGTEEILARVRVAQGKSLSSARKLWAAAVAAALCLIAACGFLLLRAPSSQQPSAPEDAALAPASAPSLTLEPEAQNEAPSHARALGTVQVQVVGHVSAILIDKKVIDTGRAWQGQLSFGPHLLEVRCAGRPLRQKVTGGPGGLLVRANCLNHTLTVTRPSSP